MQLMPHEFFPPPSALFSCLNSLAGVNEFYSKYHVVYGVCVCVCVRLMCVCVCACVCVRV